MDTKQRVKQEKDRLRYILEASNVPEEKQAALESILDNVAWMRIKLDDAREDIRSAQTVIPYDNGGGQTGIRENPCFKAYEALWKSYITGMDRIFKELPQEQQKIVAADTETTILKMIQNKHKKTG